MRILVTWGSKRGGTEGIAKVVADVLIQCGFNVAIADAASAPPPDHFDAVIIGGALYANRWHRHARRYANHYAGTLRRMPVWLFSSGPLDGSSEAKPVAPTRQVAGIAARVGALGHSTFGGRLAADARGFLAHAMAKSHAGDWRNFDRVRAWATDIARALASVKRPPAVEPPAPTHA